MGKNLKNSLDKGEDEGVFPFFCLCFSLSFLLVFSGCSGFIETHYEKTHLVQILDELKQSHCFDEYIKKESQQQDNIITKISRNPLFQKKVEELLRDHRKKLIEFPASSVEYFLYGRLLGLLGKAEDSVYFFSLSIEKDPDFLWGYYGLGLYYLKKNASHQARPYLEKCLFQNFRFVPALIAMAKLVSENNLSQSLFLLYSARRFEPENPSVWHSLGNLLASKNRLPEAVECLEQACLLKPSRQEFWKDYSAVLIKMKKYPKAIDALTKLLEFFAEGPKKKRIEKTILYLKEIIQQ